jgi:Bacterial type II/III secretion system short domain/Bacterial type II and III secretion system protein
MLTMSATNITRLGLGLALTLGFALCMAWGQEKGSALPAKADDAGRAKRLVYVVQHGSAKDLAAVLGKHFKSDAEVQVLPDSPANCLLISAPAPVFDEVVKLLAQLDRAPQSVVVEVLVAEVPAPKGDGKAETPTRDLQVKDFNGPAADVLAKVEMLQSKGVVGKLHRVQLTLVEGRPATVFDGAVQPYVTSTTKTALGVTTQSVARQNVGTQTRATAHVTPDKKIELDLEVTAAWMVPDPNVVLGTNETGAPIHATSHVTARYGNKLSLTPGQAVAAQDVKNTSKSNKEQTLIIVSARLVDPNAPFEPEPGPLGQPMRGGRGGRQTPPNPQPPGGRPIQPPPPGGE